MENRDLFDGLCEAHQAIRSSSLSVGAREFLRFERTQLDFLRERGAKEEVFGTHASRVTKATFTAVVAGGAIAMVETGLGSVGIRVGPEVARDLMLLVLAEGIALPAIAITEAFSPRFHNMVKAPIIGACIGLDKIFGGRLSYRQDLAAKAQEMFDRAWDLSEG